MERRVIVEMNNQPLVSVPVITYNSSKFVLETLESIKSQTYQNIELIISDDCSTDNTVELCQNWVKKNKERFVHTRIITSETNTGVSANLNRAEAACQGEWIKGIAGDDLLMPDCVESCLEYVRVHPDTIFLFGKITAFGIDNRKNVFFENQVFDYSFFEQNIDQQLDRLIFGGNCIPASTCFYNRIKIIEYDIINDERIPLLEDWPKWITVLKKNIKLNFIDSKLVKYRIHNESLSTCNGYPSYKTCYSLHMFNLIYRYPEWLKKNETYAHKRMVNTLLSEYKMLHKEYNTISNSYAYKLGKLLLGPISYIKKLLSNKNSYLT